MKNHTTQHLHYDDTFGDCTYSFHISIIVLEIAHTVFDNENSKNAFLSVTQKTKTIKKFGYIFGYTENKYNLGT